MSKAQSFYEPEFHGDSWSWVSMSGADAKDFLHRLTTVNVRNLIVSEGAKGCFLNPQGKIRAYFTLWNPAVNEYAFEFDAGKDLKWKTELLAVIDQFTFAEQITLTDLTLGPAPLHSLWIFPADEELKSTYGGLEALHTVTLPGDVRACRHADTELGRPWITLWGTKEKMSEWKSAHLLDAATIDFETLEGWRIEAMKPRVGNEILENSNPLESGLSDAISGNKGCYPGQEVIEKIISLGSPARRLVKIEGTLSGASPKTGDLLFNDANPPIEIGILTSAHSAPSRFVGLGVIKKIHAKEGLVARTAAGESFKITEIASYA